MINEKRTKALLVSGKRLKKRLDNTYDDEQRLQINLNNTLIDQVKSHKLLGVEIDENLDFNSHIEELTKKLSKRIGLLRHISK